MTKRDSRKPRPAASAMPLRGGVSTGPARTVGMGGSLLAQQPSNAVPRDEASRETAARKIDDYLDEQELESFPASDPHSDWAGPPSWMRETPPRESRGDGESIATPLG